MAPNAHINLRRLRLPVTAVVGVAALAVAGWVPAQPAAAEQAAAQAAGAPAPTAFRGFVLSNGRYTKFDVPGTTTKTTVGGSNDRGQLVGGYTDARGEHGFLRDTRGRITRIDVPDDAGSTSAAKVNDRGQIVGSAYRDPAATAGRGFLLAKGPRGAFTRAQVPSRAGR